MEETILNPHRLTAIILWGTVALANLFYIALHLMNGAGSTTAEGQQLTMPKGAFWFFAIYYSLYLLPIAFITLRADAFSYWTVMITGILFVLINFGIAIQYGIRMGNEYLAYLCFVIILFLVLSMYYTYKWYSAI